MVFLVFSYHTYLLGYTLGKICSKKKSLFCSKGFLTQISEFSDVSYSINYYREIFLACCFKMLR